MSCPHCDPDYFDNLMHDEFFNAIYLELAKIDGRSVTVQYNRPICLRIQEAT